MLFHIDFLVRQLARVLKALLLNNILIPWGMSGYPEIKSYIIF